MDEKPPPLWLHAYSGKEQGLMIIGTPASMRALGQELLRASDDPGLERDTVGWPRSIAAPEIVGPYKDSRGFSLSFHLQGTTPLETAAPLQRRTLWPPLFLLVATLTMVGAVSVWRWVLALFS
jgi:hypothetical protein